MWWTKNRTKWMAERRGKIEQEVEVERIERRRGKRQRERRGKEGEGAKKKVDKVIRKQ